MGNQLSDSIDHLPRSFSFNDVAKKPPTPTLTPGSTPALSLSSTTPTGRRTPASTPTSPAVSGSVTPRTVSPALSASHIDPASNIVAVNGDPDFTSVPSTIRQFRSKTFSHARENRNTNMSPSMIRKTKLKLFREQRPKLSERQIEIVLNTWTIIKQHLEHLGADMFVRLFQTYPATKSEFSTLRDLSESDERYYSEVKAHGMRVIRLLESIVDHVNQPERIITHLHQLGTKHLTYDAKPDYIDLVGPQFLFAIEPILDKHWCPEVEQAWADVFRLIGHVMKEAMML